MSEFSHDPAGAVVPDDTQQPLVLVMPVILERLEELKQTLALLPGGPLHASLDKVGTVHATHFVVLEDDEGRWAKLAVIARFDGSLEDYIAAFARELNQVFNTLFQFIQDTEDKPAPPVEHDVQRFIEYVRGRNVPPAGQYYSAYPGLTALDVYEATRARHDIPPALAR